MSLEEMWLDGAKVWMMSARSCAFALLSVVLVESLLMKVEILPA